MDRASASGAEGRRFESCPGHRISSARSAAPPRGGDALDPVGQQRCWINAEKLAGPDQVLRTPYDRSADLPTYRRAGNPQMVRKAPPNRTTDEKTLIHGEADRLIGGASTTTTQEYMSPREATAFLKIAVRDRKDATGPDPRRRDTGARGPGR